MNSFSDYLLAIAVIFLFAKAMTSDDNKPKPTA